MTDKHGTSKLEKTVASVTVLADQSSPGARVRTLTSRPLRSSSLDRKDARQDARAEARCRHPSVRRPEVAGYRCGLPGRSR